ncbi:tRNA1(Val) (adenine(37)-N6)-methyltransferase [Enterococcus dispar]|uniref:tRNA1(Val) (adenine(37)-N6)-methyltransferase n=1 Tax=Enterococcus dispar TaxID=44009 RepID=UPI0021D3FF5D|nr:tRNA1(Val) (adenine(37)-N6)-methyltransferase [Enterococcus dispar]MCU7357919.1 tRNA1(Val) (adenine(37)-N6)-methyltransferase [Enterococcus dispar]MDT2705420.1 tRNA1(Val) (adenine(37)-N6)-methyltransferase [Enterococcus dispar]
MLNKNERIDALYAEGIQIIQSSDVFSFSIDAVLLANFPKIPKRGKILDLCAGNGAVGLFISRKTQAKIEQIEIQPRLADMAKRSIDLNHLEDQMDVHELNLKDSLSVIKKDSLDLILCNPPYFKNLPTNEKNPNPHLAIARHEIHATLADVVAVSSQMLKMNGRLALVHRPDRFLEILELMQHYRIAPKRVQFVYPKENKDANIVLVEGIKDGKKDGLKILPPLTVYSESNEYTPTLKAMLYGQ